MTVTLCIWSPSCQPNSRCGNLPSGLLEVKVTLNNYLLQGVSNEKFRNIGQVARAALFQKVSLKEDHTPPSECCAVNELSEETEAEELSDEIHSTTSRSTNETDDDIDSLLDYTYFDQKENTSRTYSTPACFAKALRLLKAAKLKRAEADALENRAIHILENTSPKDEPKPKVKRKNVKGNLRFVCTECEFSCGSWGGCDSHVRKKHTADQYGPCGHCKTFRSYNLDVFRKHAKNCQK